MSLKPLKKSDLNKGWIKKRLDREIKIRPEYHLIVTEGTDTEPQYFQTMKEIINRQYRGKIQLDIYGEGDGEQEELGLERPIFAPLFFAELLSKVQSATIIR